MSLTDKYRPSSFDDVLGQDQVIKSLRRVVSEKRAKSFVFEGPSGCGKTTLARIVANTFAGGNASITSINERDAAFASGADSVRDLVRSLDYRSFGSSPVKAVIMDECHRLSKTAWDILLKPIEEPPEHVYWMLCTTDYGKLPKTIQTRCVRYSLKEVNEDALFALLVKVTEAEKFDVPDEVLNAIVQSAGGSPRQALNFLEACLSCKSVTEARAQMRVAGQSKETIDLCRFLASDRGTWAEAMRLLKELDEIEPESIRIQVVNYLSAVAKNIKTDDKVVNILMKIEAFSVPFNTSDKQAPLLLAVGASMRIGQ